MNLYGKKLKKRMKVKYIEHDYGGLVSKKLMPKYCYNHFCKHHSNVLPDECKHVKCRFKNNRFKPSEENDHWMEKWDDEFYSRPLN